MRLTTALVTALVLTSCGSGGLFQPREPVDLNGWWLIEVETAPESDVYEPLTLVQMEDWGDGGRFAGMEMIRDSYFLHAATPDPEDPDRRDFLFTIGRDASLEGLIRDFVDDHLDVVTGARMIRQAAPTGRFQGTGDVDGAAIDFDVSTAHAEADVHGVTLYDLQVCAKRPDGATRFLLSFSVRPPYPAGVRNFGLGMGEVVGSVEVDGVTEDVTTGALFVTEGGPDRFDAGYIVTLSGGGTLMGSFDVDVLVSRVE